MWGFGFIALQRGHDQAIFILLVPAEAHFPGEQECEVRPGPGTRPSAVAAKMGWFGPILNSPSDFKKHSYLLGWCLFWCAFSLRHSVERARRNPPYLMHLHRQPFNRAEREAAQVRGHRAVEPHLKRGPVTGEDYFDLLAINFIAGGLILSVSKRGVLISRRGKTDHDVRIGWFNTEAFDLNPRSPWQHH